MIRSLKEFAVAHRRAVLMLAHAAIFAFVHWLAFALRFDVSADRPFFIDMHPKYVPLFAITLALALSIKMAAFAYFRLFSGWWRYVGISDAVNLAKAATISALVFAVAAYLFLSPFGYPRSILLLDWMLTILVVGGLRISIRALRERQLWDAVAPSARRVLIVGAGDAGETLAREILSRPRLNYAPVGFVDDDPSKHGSYIHGVRVLGGVDDIPDIAARLNASEALIAVPSAGGAAVKRIVEACNRAGIESRTLPGLESLIDGRVSVSALRKVSIEDLLRREPVRLDERAIEGLVRDKIVLVTGAGGSIGSEICRQTARFGPRGIVPVSYT
ncbi:MAG: polysaccharide biosynthesis protein, partial [Planctomycetota bacterium]|nr:polysaccharide biosynthesis protein [Planctomycetota bacterium]